MKPQKIIIIFVIILTAGFLVSKGLADLPIEYSFIIPLGGLAMVVTFLRPEIGLGILLIANLFFPEITAGTVSGAYVSAKEIGIRPDDILISLIGIGWFARLVVRRELINIPKTPLNTPIIISLFIMILATTWGCFKETVTPATGFFYTLKRVQYFLIFLMVITNFRTMRAVRISVFLILIASAVVAGWAIIQHLINPAVRAYGPFRGDEAAALGGFLTICFMLAFSFFFKQRSIFYKVLLLGLILTIVYGVVFSTSRASYVAFFIALVVFAILSRRFYLLAIPVLFIVSMNYILPSTILEKTEAIRALLPKEVRTGTDEYKAPSWDSRVQAWEKAGSMVSKHPFLGQGVGSFSLGWMDNTYVLEVVTMGLIGLGIFIWLIIRIARTIWMMYQETKPPKSESGQILSIPETPDEEDNIFINTLSLGYLAALIGLLVHGIAAPTFWMIKTMTTFWFLTGLLMVAWNIREEKKLEKKVDKVVR